MRAKGQPLSETGYVDHRSLLVLWGARALYLGPALDLSPHRNAVAVLAFGVDAPFGVASNPQMQKQRYKTCRSALIKPNTQHHLRASGSMAFLYLDPLSRDYQSVCERLKQPNDDRTPGLRDEIAIVACLADLRSGRRRWLEIRPELVRLLGLRDMAKQQIDQRMADAIGSLRREPSREVDAADFAREAKLSVSRFLHVFKDATGVPFRRYRMWCRLGDVVRAAARGTSLTDAAHAAGLASSAHLSAAFRDMFGLSPSELGLQNVQLIETE